MPDLLTTIRDELDTRMRELRPFVSEYERLLGHTADESTVPTPAVTTTPRPTPGPARTPCTPSLPSVSSPSARLAPGHLHRPRRALRPAFPKAPRRG